MLGYFLNLPWDPNYKQAGDHNRSALVLKCSRMDPKDGAVHGSFQTWPGRVPEATPGAAPDPGRSPLGFWECTHRLRALVTYRHCSCQGPCSPLFWLPTQGAGLPVIMLWAITSSGSLSCY